jgi:hypothetical protein
LSHDLPNHLVVVQSLTHLLDLEERTNLGPQGREYLTRLTGAAQRTVALCKFLKEMERLRTWTEIPETVALEPVLNEATLLLGQAQPACTVNWRLTGVLGEAHVGRRSLQKILTELIQACAELAQVRAFQGGAALASAAPMNRLDLTLTPETGGTVPARFDTMALAQRPEFVLAQELAAAWNGVIQAAVQDNVFHVSLTLPTGHG